MNLGGDITFRPEKLEFFRPDCLFIRGSMGQCPSEGDILKYDLSDSNIVKWKSRIWGQEVCT